MRFSLSSFILTSVLLAASCSGEARLTLWEPVAPDMEVLDAEQRDGYRCELVRYNVGDGDSTQAYLLTPSGEGPFPGLVLLHDHGARFDIGKEKLVRPLPGGPGHIAASSAQWVKDGFDGIYLADKLAAQGYAVLVPDALYWGSRSSDPCRWWSRIRFGSEEGDERSLKKEVYEGQRAVYDSLQQKGIVWAEKTLNEDAAAARLLASLPQVDAGRIGCFGWSMGGHRAWLLAAFCPQVKAGAACGWMTLKSAQGEELSASDYSMIIPSLRQRYDFPDIARWLSPKPFLFLSGENDPLFPADVVREAYLRMHRLYGDGPLQTEFFPGGHHCGIAEQDRVIEFFNQML